VSGKSKIEWTEATWNPFRGCRKISPGCKHCYAETFAERFRGVKGHPYERGFDPRFVPEVLLAPLKWSKHRRVFVNSMSDPFLADFSDDEIDRVFAVMAICAMHDSRPSHTFQLLTKRSLRMREYASAPVAEIRARLGRIAGRMMEDGDGWADSVTHGMPWPLPNVWLGVSAEDQERADERIPDLLLTPAAVRFVSYEPALGGVNFTAVPCDPAFGFTGSTDYDALSGRSYDRSGEFGCRGPKLDWVIVGGESGRGARPFDIAWARSVVKLCKEAGVPCFVKQMGDHVFERAVEDDKGRIAGGVALRGPGGHKLAPKGGDPLEWPEDLRVREYPEVRR
jgi:protein gp37